MATKRKPGASIPNAGRHTMQRLLRLTPVESAALDSVAEARGVNVSRAVGALMLECVKMTTIRTNDTVAKDAADEETRT